MIQLFLLEFLIISIIKMIKLKELIFRENQLSMKC